MVIIELNKDNLGIFDIWLLYREVMYALTGAPTRNIKTADDNFLGYFE